MAAVEVVSELERRVALVVPVKTVDDGAMNRLKSWSRTIKMPGFRPGKVPMKMIVSQHGAQARSEVLREEIDRAFSAAVTGSDLRIAGQPKVEPREGANDETQFEFVASFEVYPKVALGDVATLAVERPVASVEEADVDNTIETLRKQRVEYKSIDRAADKGDRVIVDFEGKLDGVAFPGGTAKDFALIVGEGRMLPQFDAAMPGMAKGGTRMFDVDFPADYPGADVAGKKAEFSVTVKEVAEAILPPVDVAFAKAFGVADGDLSKLRSEVRQNLELELKRRTYSMTRDQVLKAVRDATPIAVPNSLVANEAIRMAESAQQDMLQRGVSKENAQVSPSTFQEMARERVALGLIVSEVVRTNGLHAKPEQVRKYVEEAASSYENPEQVVSWYNQDPQRMAEFEALALESNVVDWVLAKAKVTDKAVPFAQLMAPGAAQA
jgi:trigger factor